MCNKIVEDITPSPPRKNTQYDINEQLKQELMVLDGKIRNTQEVLSTTR